MELFKRKTHIDFMSRRWLFMGLSALLMLASLAVFALRGLNYSIDFTGGTLVELGFERTPDLGAVRERLGAAGFGEVIVQTFGDEHDVLVRLRGAQRSAQIGSQVLQVLQQDAARIGKVELRRVEFVGPEVGQELRHKGLMALLVVTLGILIYVGFRFEWRFAVGGVVAMLHDPILILGFFAATQMEFSLPVIAALLVIMGYSLNDTVVVFDRMREDLRTTRNPDVAQVFNIAINETLSRTVITSFITFMVALSLLVFGGPVIHGFAAALVLGIVVGTYSSIFVASPVALWLGLKREHVVKSKLIRGTDREDGARI